ncbi:MAG: cytochrome c-type biogenesis protein CcmH [Candidatus Latescibacteria bacterium]|jgi:cytochrome c-type biogenesis protein CcmH/NrfF|nr:cytochrome c-type biogenesis protein CcmH [Candidatus Latescibacterota bacterium]
MKAVKNQKPKVKGQNIAILFSLTCFLLLPLFTPLQAEITRAQIDEVGKELACLCGTCPRRPLDECTCGHAQQQRDRIKSMLASGQNTQAVIDAYVKEFGLEALSKPPVEGFSLAAWFMPPLVLIFGFFIVRSVLRSWSQTQPAATAPQTAQTESTDPYIDRLENELKERDT